MIHLSHLLQDTLSAVDVASRFIFDNVGKVSKHSIETKEKNSLVSFVDKGAEEILVRELQKVLPLSGFVTEEEVVDQSIADYTWVIDPLDGTTNFLMSIPHFAVSVALKHKDEVILGVVKEVSSGETFYAHKDGGAYLNGERITCGDGPLDEVLVATGFPYSDNYDADLYIERLGKILKKARGLRRMGSAALDMCYVACGRFGAYYETMINPWDVAAGQLIVREAGGFVSDFNGVEGFVDGSTVLACQSNIAKEMLQFLK